MTASVGRIKCKECGDVFANMAEYLKCQGCDKEGCSMGKRWKARQEANNAIEKARGVPQQVETKPQDGAKYQCFTRTCEMTSVIDETQPYREKQMSPCIAFHVMKR